MYDVSFDEAAKVAKGYVNWASEKAGPQVGPLIREVFAELVSTWKSNNEAADTPTQDFEDISTIMGEAARLAQICEDYFCDLHHNGRPTRWIKVTDHLAIHGKAEAMLVFKAAKKETTEPDPTMREMYEHTWELRWRKLKEHPDAADFLKMSISELKKEYDEEQQVTPFTLSVWFSKDGERWIERIKDQPLRPDSNFCHLVFPGLELMGYKTPVCFPMFGS